FTSRDAGYQDQVTLVPLAGLLPADGAALLTAARTADNLGEQDAARSITERLGGHPLALTLATRILRNRHGLQSYAEYAAALTPGDEVLSVVGQSVGMLGSSERTVVELAGFFASQGLPAELIEMVMSAGNGSAERPVGAGLALC